jgi:hypothetical protein
VDPMYWKLVRLQLAEPAEPRGVFEGYVETNEPRWNGWQKPVFTREQGHPLLDAIGNRSGFFATSGSSIAYVARTVNEEGERTDWRGRWTVIEGTRRIVYAIGAGSWVWELAE